MAWAVIGALGMKLCHTNPKNEFSNLIAQKFGFGVGSGQEEVDFSCALSLPSESSTNGAAARMLKL